MESSRLLFLHPSLEEHPGVEGWGKKGMVEWPQERFHANHSSLTDKGVPPLELNDGSEIFFLGRFLLRDECIKSLVPQYAHVYQFPYRRHVRDTPSI